MLPGTSSGRPRPAGDQVLRIGTWNLDARRQPAHVEFLLGLDCDVLLLTEVSPRLEVPGYDRGLTAGVMARGQHWAVLNTGPHAYRRPDGIAVVPLGLLGP